MKINFYGPELTQNIVREVNTNLNLISEENPLLETINTISDPIDVSPDSDYGFETNIIFPE
jgi:hypothetical protein